MRLLNFMEISICTKIKEEQKLKIYRTYLNKYIDLKKKEISSLKMLKDQMLILCKWLKMLNSSKI